MSPWAESATHAAAAAGEEGQEQRALELEHLALRLWFVMIIAEQVQDAVGQQEQQLVLGRVTRPDRLARGHRRAHHDVTENALGGLLLIPARTRR